MIPHLLQSTLFALVAAVLALALRNHRAAARYWVWLAASLKFLVPFALLVSAGRQAPLPAAPIAAIATSPAAIVLDTAFFPPIDPRPDPQWQAVLLALWAVGTLTVLAAWSRRYLRARNHPAVEPGVFGIFRPKLVLPSGIAGRLTPEQLRAVIAHETAHIRRRDNLFAAVHMVVQALFWFHPLVWWIGARLLEERERACDEEVLRQGADPHAYASAILEVCKFYLESPLACVSGVTGADLKRRIGAIMTAPIARRLTLAHKAILGAVAATVMALPLFLGVVHAQQDTFEVASVKPAPPGSMGARIQFTPGGGVRIENGPLLNIVMMAYNVERFQIAGAPDWIASAQYTIEGKGQAAAGADEHELARRRLQSLLAERFQLKISRTSKQGQVYELLVGKNGPKLKESNEGAEGLNRSEFGRMTSQKVSVAWLARVLSGIVRRPVIDRTGLKGTYSFELTWTPESAPFDRPKAESAGAPPPDPNGPSIFTALQEQLGLKLEPAKASIESIVIERIERPAAN